MKIEDIQIFAKKSLLEFTQVIFDENVFFHYMIYDEGTGFEFICFQKDDLEEDSIEMVVNGLAYFDGIRHLHFGDEKSDNYGYFNYPKITVILDIMKLLHELEQKHCMYI